MYLLSKSVMALSKYLQQSGDNRLGGDDFDEEDYGLYDCRLQEGKTGIDLSNDKMAMQRIKEAAEKAKKELSSATTDKYQHSFHYSNMNEGPQHFDMNTYKS